MPNMRVLMATADGPNIQFVCWLEDGRQASGYFAEPIGGNLNQQHTNLIEAAKAAQTAAYGVTFVANDKIELWCGRAV